MTHQEVAQEIIRQLGNITLSMLGANRLLAHDEQRGALGFRIKGSRKVNYIKITLNGLDLYDIEFGKIKRYDYDVVNTVENVYCDQVKDIIEENTGLFTRL